MNEINLKFFSNAGEAKMGGMLNAMLGQHQINVNDFIQEFNYKTSNILAGLPLKVYISKNKETNRLKITIKGPSLNFLLQSFVKNNKISIVDLYDVLRIFYQFNDNKNITSLIYMIFGYLSTRKIIIINLKKKNEREKK